MGVSNLMKICNNLKAEGMSSETPVAVINWATRANQKVGVGNLDTICDVVAREGLTSPSLIVIGDVVKLREKLNFFEERPLFGKTIVTTRARSQASKLSKQLEELGANVIEFPTIRIEAIEPNPALDEKLEKLGSYQYIIFTSQNTVKLFFEKLLGSGKDVRALAGIKVLSVGPATAEALKQYGIIADLMPKRFVSESVCELLQDKLHTTDRILIPKAVQTREILEQTLKQYAVVETVNLYENVMDDSPKSGILEKVANQTIDYITFTSASTVKNFLELVGKEHLEAINKCKLIAIGSVTAKTMNENGLHVYAQPDYYTIDKMVECILKDQQKRGVQSGK